MENMFREYDIRGILDKEVNETTVEKIGKAFGTFLKGKGTVVISRDTRNKGDMLKESLIKGLTSTGVNVIDIGMQCTPVMNFYCKDAKATAGAQITASHNPSNYSGVRFRKEDGTGNPECVPEVKKIFFSEKYIVSKKQGNIRKVEETIPQTEFTEYVFSKMKIKKPICIVIDPGNGATSNFAKTIFEKAGHKVFTINDEPDGNFPGRGPDPKPTALIDLGQEVRINNADIGIAFDGDGDRVVFVDDEGEVLSADETGYIIAKEILKTKKGTIVMNVECSKTVEDFVNENGGTTTYVRVGDAFLAGAVKEHNAIFAMENSNHFLIPEYAPADDGLITGFFFAKMLGEIDKPLSELRKKVIIYPKEKKEFDCIDTLKFKVVESVKNRLKTEHKVLDIDGARINFEHSWILIRASNTTPKIRLTAEAKTENEVDLLIDKFGNIIEEEMKKVET